MRSYNHFVVHYSNDGPRPRTPEQFRAMVVEEVESEANLGPGANLKVLKPGKLVGYKLNVPGTRYMPNKDIAPYIEYLYKVRVHGPYRDLALITGNLKSEYGRQWQSGSDKRLKYLGWKPYKGKGI